MCLAYILVRVDTLAVYLTHDGANREMRVFIGASISKALSPHEITIHIGHSH